MSTNSCIIVKMRKEDIGRPIKFNKDLLPSGVKVESWVLKDQTGRMWHDERSKEKSKTIIPTGKYIAIYCHWDGGKANVGAALKNKFSDYHQALNLLAGGWCSAIEEERIKHYANRKGENWKYILPVFGDTIKEILNKIGQEYCYLLDEKGWRCCTNERFVKF